jgi:hypothetical protein
MLVSSGSAYFHCDFSQPDACLGIGPTMAHCTSFVCMEFGPAQVESGDGHFFFIPATNWGISFLFNYPGSALQVDRLEPSPSADGICWQLYITTTLLQNIMLLLFPLALGLAFYVKPWWGRVLCLVSILLIFLPAVSLSMARGAWVGHMGGVIGVSLGLLLFLRFHLAQSEAAKAFKGKTWFVPTGFILLGLSLPAFLYTSDFWKKGGRGWERLDFGEEETFQVLDPQTKLPEKKVMKEKPIIAQTKEAKELKSITTPSKSGGSMRRLVLWEDAIRECFSNDFLLGKGTDHYELFYHQSAELSDKNWGKTLVRFVHNDFIQTFYENGFLGILGWLGIWGFVCWQAGCLLQRAFFTGW